jgi:hypothetical protein
MNGVEELSRGMTLNCIVQLSCGRYSFKSEAMETNKWLICRHYFHSPFISGD